MIYKNSIFILILFNFIKIIISFSSCTISEECCSHISKNSDILCCGSSFEGNNAIKCIEGKCYSGSKECYNSYDNPLCNIPSKDSIQKENLNKCKKIFKDKNQPNEYEYGGLALHEAIKIGQTDIVTNLINEGHNVNKIGNGGATSLHIAVLSDNGISSLPLLIHANANINIRNNSGFTPLHRAVQNSQIHAVSLLLHNNADIDIQEEINGNTPLHLAALDNENEIADLLISYGANTNILNNNNQRPFDIGLFDMQK